jgi:anti-anti-sigma regulatory factor
VEGGPASRRHATGDTVVIELSGPISGADTGWLSRVLLGAVRGREHRRTLLDLADVPYVDPQAAGAIVAGSAVAADSGVHLVVRGARAGVRDLLCTLGLPPHHLAADGS